MSDLRDPRLIYLKGCLFFLGGLLAGVALLLERPSLRAAFLYAAGVWCFARFYYFVFWVIPVYLPRIGRHRGH